jgi:hypothetical protein
MKIVAKLIPRLLRLLALPIAWQSTAWADAPAAGPALLSPTPDSRHGLFDGLDERSFYNQGDFPEPFLVDDSGLERNEARLDWRRQQTGAAKTDTVTAEYEKGFGLATLEIEVPYERDASAGAVTQGIGNVSLGARCPFYQYVSPAGFFDTTLGGAFELGIPASSAISVNPEFVPKLFQDIKMGNHFTLQSVYGYSIFGGGGAEGGGQTFEYGYVLGWTIPHAELPLPGVQQFIPICELQGETALNHSAAGQNTLLGDAGFRLNLDAIGRVQLRPGLAVVFPLDNGGRQAAHWGLAFSFVMEF